MKRRAGYSLVEVLVAFVVMTLVLTVLIPGQAVLLGRATVLEEAVLAHDYALSRAARLGFDTPLEVGLTLDTYRDWEIATIITQGGTIGTDTETLAIAINVADEQGRDLATVQTLRVVP